MFIIIVVMDNRPEIRRIDLPYSTRVHDKYPLLKPFTTTFPSFLRYEATDELITQKPLTISCAENHRRVARTRKNCLQQEFNIQ